MSQTELIRNADGSVYHLGLKPGELAKKIILVGDPARVAMVSRHFDRIEVERYKREFRTHTGWMGDQRLSVISTGIGTDNIDIVITEVDALFNLFDGPRNSVQALSFLRMGTCGGIQGDVPVGTFVHSRFALGSDGLLHFYRRKAEHVRVSLEHEVSRYFERIGGFPVPPYGAVAASGFHQLLNTQFPQIKSGITFSANGFYGPQGRYIGRLQPFVNNLPQLLSKFSYRDLRVLNIEMETAGILGLSAELGHEAASLSVILANRHTGVFAEQPKKEVKSLIEVGLEVMLAHTPAEKINPS